MPESIRRTPHDLRRIGLRFVMAKIEFFRSTDITTDCDQCGGRVDLIKGGVCTRCRRILCYQHLHGSFTRRLLTDLGADVVCVKCRAARH
jgi:hypothetical protein